MMRITRPLSPRFRAACGILGVLMVALLAWLDFRKGGAMSLSLLYVIPIGLATWLGGRWMGTSLSLLCAGLLLLADLKGPARPYQPETAAWNATMATGLFLTLSLILSALRDALDREKALARLDPLTGVANGRGFYEVAERELARARRHNTPLTLVYMDLDNFKSVNDRHGHQTGDRLLQAVADTFRSHLRATDVVGRLGGDEFALLLPETALGQARERLDKLHQDLLEAMRRRHWPVTFSIGAMSFPTPPDSVDQMIQKADALMYTVKNGGKARLEQSEDARQTP